MAQPKRAHELSPTVVIAAANSNSLVATTITLVVVIIVGSQRMIWINFILVGILINRGAISALPSLELLMH